MLKDFWKKVNERDEQEETLQVLCLTVLIANEKLPYNATLEDADNYFNDVGDCGDCPFRNKCMACILEA
jgi:hypothetical protein